MRCATALSPPNIYGKAALIHIFTLSTALDFTKLSHTAKAALVKVNVMKTFEFYDRSFAPDSHLEATLDVFNPMDYLELLEDGYALCRNPVANGGLSAITVNTRLTGEALRTFEASVKRMVLAKLFSPKFGEVILSACGLHVRH